MHVPVHTYMHIPVTRTSAFTRVVEITNYNTKFHMTVGLFKSQIMTTCTCNRLISTELDEFIEKGSRPFSFSYRTGIS